MNRAEPSLGGTAADAWLISGLTLVSRLSGVVRVLVAGAILGRGPLGDLYQTVNTIPNLLFELLAGGALQAALVPAFVSAVETDESGFDRSVGAVASLVSLVLGGLVLVAAAVSPALVWVLTRAEPDPGIAADKRRLGTWMLLFFLPQLVFYGLGMVASAALAARRRFGAAAIAPLVNNIVVVTAYVGFDRLRGGRAPDLSLSGLELLVLAGGTTLAVVGFTLLPLVALLRSGSRPRSRLGRGDPVVAAVRRTGGWAVLQVAATLSLQVAMLIIGNGAPGGVALFVWGTTFFLLPTALVASPVATALAPRLAAAHQRGEIESALPTVRRSALVVVVAGIVAALGLFVLAWPLVNVLPLGELSRGGVAPVAHTLQAFAPGIPGYAITILATRALFSIGELRGAALDTLGAAVLGIGAMVVVAALAPETERAAALGGAYGVAFTVAAALLASRFRRCSRVSTAQSAMP